MRIMKKIAVVLTAFMLLCTLGAPSFANIDDVPVPKRLSGGGDDTVKDTVSMGEYEGIYKVLNYLGILSEEDGEIEASKELERGFVAGVFSNIISPDYEPEALNGFSDVSKTAKYSKEIYSALEQGIVSKADKFYPSRIITCAEAVKMAMNTLGYTHYPNEFLVKQKANSLRLYNKVGNETENLTMGGLMYLIKNTIEASTAEADTVKIDGDDVQVRVSEVSPAFIERKDIVLRQGIVTAQKNTSMFGDSDLQSNEIEINRQRYECISQPDENLLGKTVYAYIDTKDGKNLLISAYEAPNKNSEFVILDTDFKNATVSQLSYSNENDKVVSVKVETGATVIYNNQYYGSMQTAINAKIFDNASNITLISNDGDNSFDVVRVEKYKYVVVNAVSTLSEFISLMYNEGKIDARLNKDSFILYTDGIESDISTLAKWDVLSVLEAKRGDGKKNYTVYSARKIIKGALDTIENVSGVIKYTINNKAYIVSPDYDKYVTNNATSIKPVMGETAEFLLSHDDKIVSVKTENEYEYAYLMDAEVFGSLEKVTSIKVFTFDGKCEELSFSSKATLYSDTYPSGQKLASEDFYNELYSNGKLVSELIAFKRDTNGNIKEIYLEKDLTSQQPGSIDYPITKNYTAGGTGSDREEARLYANVIAGKYQATKQTTSLIIVPDESKRTDEDEYMASTLNIYPSDHYFSTESFTLYNADKFYSVSLMVVKGSVVKEVDEYITPVMVSKVTRGVKDDESVYNFYYYNGTNNPSITVSNEAEIIENVDGNFWYGSKGITLDDIEAGDIVQISTDSKGVGRMIRVLFKNNDRGTYRVQTQNDSNVSGINKNASSSSKLSIIYGKIIDIEGSKAIVNVSDSGEDGTYSYPVFISALYGPVTYTLYETVSGNVYLATLSEIQPGDTVVLRKRWNATMDIFIIR